MREIEHKNIGQLEQSIGKEYAQKMDNLLNGAKTQMENWIEQWENSDKRKNRKIFS